MVVTNLCKGFSLFSESEALSYADASIIELDNTLFNEQVEEDLSSQVDAICEELTRRLLVFDLNKASESTMREFIGPVLVQAVLMFQARDENPNPVKMVAERKLFGSLGNGPVDYIGGSEKGRH